MRGMAEWKEDHIHVLSGKRYAAVGMKEEGHASDTDPRPGAYFETLGWDTGRICSALVLT